MGYPLKVLIVATSHKTRGGITSVVEAHKEGDQWKKYHCKWIETHIDKNAFCKLLFLIKGLIRFVILLPFYDIVHIHTSEPASAFRKSIFVFWAKLFNKRVIIHFHSFSPDTTIKGKHQKVYRYLFGKSDSILVLSEFWKKELLETFNVDGKVKVIYNPCIVPKSEKHYEKKYQILYAGAVNERKGYKDLIKAFALVAAKYPDWKVIFAGNGGIEEGKLLGKELGVDEQLVFLGWINGEDKDKAFQEASVFCLPSYAEGFPMAVLDAWAYALPVITTPVGGLSDVLIDNVNALVFLPGDIESLSLQIDKMITNTTLRTEISRESSLLSQTTFNRTTINSQLDSIYANFLKK